MSDADERDEEAVMALANAMRKGWPARGVERAAEGWARVLIVVLRKDGERLGHDVTVDRLAQFLASSFVELERTHPKPSEPWAAHTARRIAEEL